MPPSPLPGFGGPTRHATMIAVGLAVVVHVGIIALLARRSVDARGRKPPAVEGVADREAAVGGVPLTKARNQHLFRVLDVETGAPIASVRVADVFGDHSVVTGPGGTVVVMVRSAAKLLVQAEKPGYAMHAERYENTSNDPATHTIFLARAPVRYALVDTIFIQRCNYCHGGVGTMANIDLTSFDRVMRSRTGAGPIVVPFNPDSSRLIRVLMDSAAAGAPRSSHARRTAQLDAFEIETLAEWVREGARATTRRR